MGQRTGSAAHDAHQTTNLTWSLWEHAWSPSLPGAYEIRLRVDDLAVPQQRLAIGYYDRAVQIP